MNKEVKVVFDTSDDSLKRLYDDAERKCLLNIKDFSGRKVLVEGGGYEKIWLETQPMGGEMYAKRNLEIGLNNQLLFMEYAREDGRIPGSIAYEDGKIIPQFNKFQGFCFPQPALNMYYLAEPGIDYLDMLYTTLERFDEYLWRVRDSDHDGCLESWCKYDTGEDNAVRYMDAPDGWEEEYPPQDCRIVPMASLDVMSYSYTARETLMEISQILGKQNLAEMWKLKSKHVSNKIREYLWNEDKGTCFDRDKNHFEIPILYHNTLRAMYWHSIDQDMADAFVKRHLLNPDEFWTEMPLPSVAVNDSAFRNISTNNWSGQSESLTYQRAIRALENYGYDSLIPKLGRRFIDALKKECRFVQQFDPFTGEISRVSLDGEMDAYGPAILSTLEYISRIYGVHREKNYIYWGCTTGSESIYEQHIGEHIYSVENTYSGASAKIDGREIFETKADVKIVTDLSGNIVNVVDL
ncbi:MAG: hypothetical protein J5684_01530 [Eubacterium sp.]|nr:hypothetical protein [Eubacterium sp.]